MVVPRDVSYRAARPSDARSVAALHADSWRRNYRGAYLDRFLDGDVETDRLAVWTERLQHPHPNDRTLVAEVGDALVGFVHTVLDDDPEWGALVDNLHVVHALKGAGVGTGLLAEAGRAVLEVIPPTGVYLWVLEQNADAQAFYRARGGVCVGRRIAGPFPGGGHAPALRYAWADPSVLVPRNGLRQIRHFPRCERPE